MYEIDELSTPVVGRPGIHFIRTYSTVRISPFHVVLKSLTWNTKLSHQQPQPYPRQQKINAMNGAHLASPIRGELGYAHWPPAGNPIYLPIGHQIWGTLGKQDGCPNFALTVAKFVFINSGNFRAKANPPKPISCPKRPFGQCRMGENSSADWVYCTSSMANVIRPTRTQNKPDH